MNRKEVLVDAAELTRLQQIETRYNKLQALTTAMSSNGYLYVNLLTPPNQRLAELCDSTDMDVLMFVAQCRAFHDMVLVLLQSQLRSLDICYEGIGTGVWASCFKWSTYGSLNNKGDQVRIKDLILHCLNYPEFAAVKKAVNVNKLVYETDDHETLPAFVLPFTTKVFQTTLKWPNSMRSVLFGESDLCTQVDPDANDM